MSIRNIIVRSCAFSGLSNFSLKLDIMVLSSYMSSGATVCGSNKKKPHAGVELFSGCGIILFDGSWGGSSELHFVGYMAKLNTEIVSYGIKKLHLNPVLYCHKVVLCYKYHHPLAAMLFASLTL